MVRTENSRFRRLSVAALRILAVAVAYYVAARIGLLQHLVVAGTVVTPLWPATGIALTALLWMGLRIWPGIVIGTFLVILSITSLRLDAVFILAGNTLAPICSYLMLRRVGFRVELDRLRDGVALVFLGALAGMLISATAGTGVQLVTGALPADDFWPAWSAWWAGDAMGVLVITPLLLALRTVRPPRHIRGHRWAEAVTLLVVMTGVALIATRSSLALLFLVFPLLVWAALRFQLLGAAPCTLIVSVLAILAATDQAGPFKGHSVVSVMVNLQALNGSAALTGLLLAAIVAEHQNTRRKIELACKELAEVVEHLSPGATSRRWPPPTDGRRRGGASADD